MMTTFLCNCINNVYICLLEINQVTLVLSTLEETQKTSFWVEKHHTCSEGKEKEQRLENGIKPDI